MDLSKLPDAQRQELEQLQKQFQEHQAQQQKQQEASAAAAAAAVQQQPPPYDPSQIHHSYDPSQAYDQSYYYNYNYQDPSQQQQQQYDASYYQNYYPNPYQQQQQPETLVGTAVPSELERNAGSGQVQDPYVHPIPGYPAVPSGLNAAAAAAVAALSQLTQFAGTMGAAERAGGGGYGPPMTAQGHFRPPPVGHPPPYSRGGGRRPFGGRGNFGFRPPPPFHGRGGRGGRGRGGRPSPSSSQSHPLALEEPAAMKKIAWCELCRVDCTSKEILETHKNGKRHQKNLQRLQQVKDEKPPLASEMKQENEATNPNPNPNPKADADDEKKPWLKRKMKGGGGRGGKRPRPTPGPSKPKVVIPLMCDLCNVKCDTQEVFDRHVGGKKHIAKLKRFQGHQAMFGPTAVQALYPPNPLSLSQQTQPPPPPPPQNPNPQIADAPLQFATDPPQPAQVSTHGV